MKLISASWGGPLWSIILRKILEQYSDWAGKSARHKKEEHTNKKDFYLKTTESTAFLFFKEIASHFPKEKESYFAAFLGL